MEIIIITTTAAATKTTNVSKRKGKLSMKQLLNIYY